MIRFGVDRPPESLTTLCPAFAAAAQKVYDEWVQDEDGMDPDLGAGGICQDIAAAISEVFATHGHDAAEVAAACGEQHVFVVVRWIDEAKPGVYEVDISPYIYERGGGYRWRKIPGVVFRPSDIVINRLSADPDEFDEYTES